MSKFTGLHVNFAKFRYQIKHGFSCIDVHRDPREMLKPEGDRSDGYNGKLDQPMVHG